MTRNEFRTRIHQTLDMIDDGLYTRTDIIDKIMEVYDEGMKQYGDSNWSDRRPVFDSYGQYTGMSYD